MECMPCGEIYSFASLQKTGKSTEKHSEVKKKKKRKWLPKLQQYQLGTIPYESFLPMFLVGHCNIFLEKEK